MANMITRPIASAAERIAASTYIWCHTGSGPATDRRLAATDIVTRDASGNAQVGNPSTIKARFHIRGPASQTTTLTDAVTNAALLIEPWQGSAWGLAIGSIGSQVQSIQGVDTSASSSREIALNPLGGKVGIGTSAPLYKFHSNLGGDGVAAIFSGITKGVRVNHTTTDTRLEGVSHDGTTFQPLIIGGSSVDISIAGTSHFQYTSTQFLPLADNSKAVGSASLRFSTIYAGTGTINTSDERLKTEIGNIPDEWLDAWGDVQWQRFKFIDGNRWHVGLIAQAVHSAFAGHGLDAFDIGLCCYDAWEEQREPIFETITKTRLITAIEQEPAGEDENGEPLFRMREVEVEEEYEETVDTGETRVTLEAGDRWGLRYDECQAIEAAWNRRELSRMAARLAALEE